MVANGQGKILKVSFNDMEMQDIWIFEGINHIFIYLQCHVGSLPFCFMYIFLHIRFSTMFTDRISVSQWIKRCKDMIGQCGKLQKTKMLRYNRPMNSGLWSVVTEFNNWCAIPCIWPQSYDISVSTCNQLHNYFDRYFSFRLLQTLHYHENPMNHHSKSSFCL